MKLGDVPNWGWLAPEILKGNAMHGMKWKNVSGFLSIEVNIDELGVYDISSEKGYGSEEFAELKPYIATDGSELVIDFLSSGYYEPKSMYGGPDNLGWPEEGDDERTPDGASVDGVELPKELAEKLFYFYENEIKDVELDYEPDEPDYGPDD